jgi:hypothetical protein
MCQGGRLDFQALMLFFNIAKKKMNILLNPYELSIQDLEQLIAGSPTNSVCARAMVEEYKRILDDKKQQEGAG